MVNDKISKPFKGIVLFPVHVRFYFTVKANRNLVFSKALCDAGSTAVRVIYWVAAAFMVNTSAKRNFHKITSLFDLSPYIYS